MIAATTATTGCIEDPDCGICDPDNLILQSISGVNYGLRKVHLLSPTCVGDECPAEFDEGEYFIEKLGPCEEDDDALEADRGPEEFCKLAPIAGTFGIEFIFNNLLEAQSLEQVRKRPDNPQLFEVYDWKTQVLEIQGPITRFNGDFYKGEGENADIITRSVNLSCIDNLRDMSPSQDYGHEDYEGDWRDNPCNATTGGAKPWPLKMRREESDGSPPVIKSYRGELDWRAGSCDTPDDRADDCCSVCDFELSVNVAKYGLTAEYTGDGRPDQSSFRTPNNPGDPGDPRGAIMCDPLNGDKYVDCAGFVPWINRSTEVRTYDYEWNTAGTREPFPLPVYDKLRETHPDERPDGLERKSVPCTQDADCTSANAANMPGSACVGELASGVPGLEDLVGTACDPTRHDPGQCANAHCVAQWFVTCRADADTTGAQGYCRDTRFYDRGAPACLRVTEDFTATDPEQGDYPIESNKKIAECDRDLSGLLTARECCKEGLGTAPSSEQSCSMALPCNDTEDSACDCPDGETCCPPFEVCIAEQCWTACDPLMQPNTKVVPIFERNVNLPDVTRGCMCKEPVPEECKTIVDNMCREDSDPDKPIKEEREGQYAMKMVTKVGGIVYDPSIKGFDWRPGHIGHVERALIEQCAEGRNLIGGRNIETSRTTTAPCARGPRTRSCSTRPRTTRRPWTIQSARRKAARASSTSGTRSTTPSRARTSTSSRPRISTLPPAVASRPTTSGSGPVTTFRSSSPPSTTSAWRISRSSRYGPSKTTATRTRKWPEVSIAPGTPTWSSRRVSIRVSPWTSATSGSARSRCRSIPMISAPCSRRAAPIASRFPVSTARRR